MIQPDPLPDAEGNLTLPGSDDPDNPNVYAQQNLRDGDLSFTLRRGTRIIVARETSSVGLAFLANNITAEIEAGAEIFSPDRAVLVFADNIVVNNRGDIEDTGTDGGSESFSVDTTSAFRLNNFGRIESRTGTSINIGILATGVQIHNEKGGRIIGGRGINSDGISESFGRGSRVSVEQEGDGLAAQVFNRGVIQTGTGTPGAFAVDLRRFGGLLENLGEGQIIGGVRIIGNRARLFNDGSIDAGNQRHNLAIDFGASPGSRTRILASNNRPVLNPNDRIFNTSQTLEIGPHSQINGTIRFGAKAADPEDATTSVPDVLKFVARDADENGTQDPFIDMNLLVIDDFDLDKTALPANRMVMISEPLEGDELQEFIKAGFVGQDENGNLLQGENAGRDLIVRRVALLATPAPIVPPVEPPESVDPEPVVPPIVPPVINPPDTETTEQAGSRQPDANIGQPDNTDGEQGSVQGMMVSGDADSNGDTEPQMPVNPLPSAPVSPPDSVDPEPMVQPGVPPVINPPDSDSNGQAGGQQPDANIGQPNNTDGEQGSVQGMMVSGDADSNGDTEPQMPVNPLPPAPVNPPESVDPEPMVQPGVPPVINPPDSDSNGQAGGQQPDANIGQPNNTDGEQGSVQGMMVSGDADSNGDTEPQMPVNPLPSAPVSPPESVDPEPMVSPGVPPVINPPDTATNGQAAGQQPDANTGQPDNTDGEQGSVQGMVVSGDADSNGDTEPQMPVNPTPPAPVSPAEPVDPEPMVQPGVPPVINPPDSDTNGQASGQQPDANTGQPDNTDGEQSSVQGMMVLGGADGNGTSEQGSNLGMMVPAPSGTDGDRDAEPPMPVNPLPPAPVSPPESVDPEPMVQPGIPPLINPTDTDSNRQPDGNVDSANGASQQGSNLGMMVPASGSTDGDGDTEPQMPINPTPPTPVSPAEPVDPEPVVQPGVPPVINPPDADTNGQAGGQQPDANTGQPNNTDGEQSSVQGMMVSGDADSNGDTEPPMPVNPTPPAPVSPPGSVDPEPMVQPGVPPVINPPDTATSEQPDGTREQDNNQNRVVPNGVDQQGNRQGMVVSGTDNTHDNNQPAGPDGNGASEQPDTHTTQTDGEGNEGESAPPVPATPTDTTVPPQVVASEQTSRVFQAQFLAQTAERIFAAPTRRLGDTRPLASRFKVSRANVGRPLTKLSTGLNLNGSDEQPNNSSAAWLSALGGQSRRHAGGAEQVFAGLAVGTERLLNPEVLGGIYTGVLRSDPRLTSGRELHSRASFVGLYGRLERADTLMDLDIGVAYQRYKRQRRVLENGTVRMAHADHGGWLLGAGLGIGQRLHLGARRSFTPLLRLRYSGAFDQGYTERGTQANLTVDNNVTHLLEGRLQGIYGQELAFTSGTGHLTLSLGALVRRASGNDRFSGSLFGQRFSHRLTGQKNSEYGGLLSLGFGIPVADRGRLFGRVEGVFLGRDDSDLSAVVGVQIDF